MHALAMTAPIFEPEFSYLPEGCECGARFRDAADLQTHRESACALRFGPGTSGAFRGLDFGGRYGVADGGRRA